MPLVGIHCKHDMFRKKSGELRTLTKTHIKSNGQQLCSFVCHIDTVVFFGHITTVNAVVMSRYSSLVNLFIQLYHRGHTLSLGTNTIVTDLIVSGLVTKMHLHETHRNPLCPTHYVTRTAHEYDWLQKPCF